MTNVRESHAYVTPHLRKHWSFLEESMKCETMHFFPTRFDSKSIEFESFRVAVSGMDASESLSVWARVYVKDSNGVLCSPCSHKSRDHLWSVLESSPLFVCKIAYPLDFIEMKPVARAFAYIDGLLNDMDAQPCEHHNCDSSSNMRVARITADYDFRDLEILVQYKR